MRICNKVLYTFFFLLQWQVASLGALPIIAAEERVVESVVDGDTLRVKSPTRNSELVRLIGIDTPELHHSEKFKRQQQKAHTDAEHLKDLGERAQRVTRSMLPPGTVVEMESDAQMYDRYGRRLAYVFLKDGTFINREILLRGYAHLLTVPPNVARIAELRKAYLEARDAKRGLWSFEIFSAQRVEEQKVFPPAGRRIDRLPAGRPKDVNR